MSPKQPILIPHDHACSRSALVRHLLVSFPRTDVIWRRSSAGVSCFGSESADEVRRFAPLPRTVYLVKTSCRKICFKKCFRFRNIKHCFRPSKNTSADDHLLHRYTFCNEPAGDISRKYSQQHWLTSRGGIPFMPRGILQK